MRGDRVLDQILEPIRPWMDHPEVTDICINVPLFVWVRQSGAWTKYHVPSFDFDTLDAATILIGQRSGREFDEEHPYVNSTMPGNRRFQGVRPPGTRQGNILWAIRRPPDKARHIDDDDFDRLFEETDAQPTRRRRRVRDDVVNLYREALETKKWRPCFRAARMAGMSMAFCGATGSGKTDMARRMIQVGRPNVRMVTIETDDEFGDAGPENKAPLFYDESQISSDEAVRIAKRLIPVEIFLQEVRGAEAYSLLTALNSGHAGCTSWHATESKEEEALANMVREHPSGRELKEERLMEIVGNAFDIITYCDFDGKKYRVSSVRLMAAEEEMA